MIESAGWKKKKPLLLAAVVIAGLAAVTLWVRKPVDLQANRAVQRTPTDARLEDGASADSTASRPVRRDTATSATNAVEMRRKMKESIARRARMREQQARASGDARQRAIASYRTERVDPAWAVRKEAELTGIATSADIAAAKIAPKTLDIDCKSTMCRLNGSFSGDGQAQDWALYYMSSVGSALPNSVVTRTQNPDGSTSIEIYGKAR